ncbi:MAG: InlB B-repeat-containing protein, partial [Raoultibacter sp.]
RSLPSTFVFSDKSTLAYLTYAFKGCASLSSLPAGFKIPTSVEIMIEAFKDCSSLTILPSSFDFPAQASTASAFACDLVDGKRLTTYYSGSSATVLNYDWTSQNRTLVANSEDRGMYEVAYKVQAPTEPFAWETRSTVLTDKNGIATDPGSPSLEGYTFTGWSTDEECLEPFDFSTTLTSATTLYGKWIKHGGINSEEGKLPTEMPDGTKGFDAWWRITADGTFVIGTKNPEATLQSFGWEYVYPGDTWTPSENYWSVYSSEVTKVIMLEGIKTTSTAQWFRAMTHLTDVSRVYIPEGTVDASFMFDGAMSLKALPADFALPESVERVVAMFRTCESLEVLPNNFRLPKNVITVNSMFAATLALTTLPETLLLSENVEDAAYYLSKSGISSLPSNFRIPSSVKSVFRLLDQCKNLTALPEGFGFDTPQNVVNVERMLEDTAKMTSLPASFELNGLSQEAKEGKLVDGVLVHGGWANMLGFRNEKPTTPITTYYAGNPANIPTDTELFWTNQKRALVTSMPAGCYQGSFLLPDDSGQYSDVWIKPLTDTAGVLTEPVAPVRAGQVFLGWYTDASCTTKFDFTKALTANATIYGKYYALSGALPTEASPNNTDLSVASWKLLSDGTLSIDCAKGEILADFGWDSASAEWSSLYWGSIRKQVKAVRMGESVRTSNMSYWFAAMTGLVDVSGVFVPDGVKSVDFLFAGCSSLKSLPKSCVLPGSVVTVIQMFDGCANLDSLPVNFAIPASVTDAYGMFAHTNSLEYLPEGFRLPEGIENTQSMFLEAKALKSLPDDFTIPKTAIKIRNMFYSCASLASLPQGFRIPDDGLARDLSGMFSRSGLVNLPEGFSVPSSATSVNAMFDYCAKLTTLPSSLDLSKISAIQGIGSMFSLPSDPYAATNLITYYPGDPAKLLGKDYWKTNYKRTLYGQDDPLPTGTHTVTLKTKDPVTGVFTTSATLLSDASGKVVDPGFTSQFGYAFSGWCKQETCEATSRFDFANESVTENTVLYGMYSLLIKYDVPLTAKLSIDAMGSVSVEQKQIKSFTPAKLKVDEISCVRTPSADELMDETTLNGLAVTLQPSGALRPLYLGFGEAATSNAFVVGKATGVTSPGILDYSISLSLPPNPVIKFQQDGWATDLAKLEYKLSVSTS